VCRRRQLFSHSAGAIVWDEIRHRTQSHVIVSIGRSYLFICVKADGLAITGTYFYFILIFSARRLIIFIIIIIITYDITVMPTKLFILIFQ
jgi:hypothetical protein